MPFPKRVLLIVTDRFRKTLSVIADALSGFGTLF